MLDKRVKQELMQDEENLEMCHCFYESRACLCNWRKIKKRNSLETKKKMFHTRKRPLDYKHKIKQVVSNNRRNSKSGKRKQAMVHYLYDQVEALSYATERAEEVQAYLGAKFSSFVKPMLQSNVVRGFWLSLPRTFCKMHLPSYDAKLVLVDESGEEYKTIYIAERTGLSGGWRRFSIEHELVVDDVLVFQLIEPSKIKVYIVRANWFSEVDAALGLMSIAKANNFDQSENNSGNVSLEISEARNYSRAFLNFNEVKSFENFTILVNGLSIDTRLLEQVRTKYYELCCSQNSFLHDHLRKGTDCRLAVEMITETVNIANAIKACKLSTSQDEFESWDKTLLQFEQLGMNVGFLRARLKQLVSIAFKSEEALNSKRHEEARLERAHVEEEMRNLELKYVKLEEVAKDLEVEIEALEETDKKHKLMFDEEVNAPW